jgi:hypothetical protein
VVLKDIPVTPLLNWIILIQELVEQSWRTITHGILNSGSTLGLEELASVILALRD